MSLTALKKAARSKKKDTFEDGTVVRWTAAGRYNYAAIKTVAGWFTTAASYNTFVKQVLTFDELLEVIARSESTEVKVSETWKDLS